MTQSGNEVTVSASENTTSGMRSGYIYFNVYLQSLSQNEPVVETYYLEVFQSVAGISATASRLDFNNTAGSKSFTLSSDLAWTATTSSTWISVEPEQGSAGDSELTVSVTDNGSADNRNGYVYIQMAGGNGIEIPVSQRGLYIDVQDTLYFQSTSYSREITLNTNLPSWNVINKPDWVSLSPDNGESGEQPLTLTVEDNPNTTGRNGEITVGNSGLSVTRTIRINQAGKSFGPLESVMTFENTASSATLTITTDGAWTATPANDWITVTPTSGQGNAELTVSVAANDSDNERTGMITVMVGNTARYVNVVQQGRYFTIDRPTSASLPSTGGTIELGIATNQTWTATIADGSTWLALSATQGEGNAHLVVSVTDNPNLNSRTDTIVFTPANGRQGIKLTVTQAGRYLRTSTQNVSFFYKGGTATPVTIDTDGTFRVEKPTEANWLTVNVTNNLLTFTAGAYDDDGQRSTTVSVYLTGLAGESSETKMAEITVTQYSRNTQFVRDDYDEDINLEINYENGTFVTRTDYGADIDMEE